MFMKKYAKLFLKIFVSLAFLFWVVFKVDWGEVLQDIRSIDIPYLVVYVLTVLLGMIISAYKWKVLANFKKIYLSFGDFFKYYLTGTFINNFMPSFVGGDTFKAYETGKRQGRYIEAASAVIMDRITGLFGATILALIFTILNIKHVIGNTTLIVVNLLILFSFALDILIPKVRKHPFWGRFKKYLPEKLVAFIIDLGTYNGNSKILKKSVYLSFLFSFVGVATANYILFLALGLQMNILDYLSVIFLISIVASVPVSINNIGIKEWAYITFFGVFGLEATQVVSVAIISRFIQMFISFFALPIYLRRNKK
jgi:glycosyltransferase 2 family protein